MRFTIPLLFGLSVANAFVVQPNVRPVVSPFTTTELSAVAKKKGLLRRIFGGGKSEAAPSGTKPATIIPPSDDTPFDQIANTFPDAMTNKELIDFMTKTLNDNGYDENKTLIATSLCCDEVNRPLETDLSNVFDTNFNMGGLAGFPFGGATSFGAMAAHIPDGGACAVIYGPHVGVDSKGKIGTVERRGRANGGACCGSAVAASGYVAGVLAGEPKASLPSSALDAQQYFVGSMLMPYAERLDAAEEKMKELPYALYDAQSELMERILAQSGSAVGDGTAAVLGGIQINTPPGYSDYFLPLSFDMYDKKGKITKKLLKTDNKRFPKIADTFPGALTNGELVDKVTAALKKKGYDNDKTLVATSLCCDEVNRPLENELSAAFDTNFNMGGLAGFPFGGATSFGAMAGHIPDGGDCVVVYGPHVGVDSKGNVGTTERRGRVAGGACCGSAVAASAYVAGVKEGAKKATLPDDPLDAQQYFVGSMLMPYAERLAKADDRMVELPYALYDAQTDLMKKIVGQSAGAVAGNGKIAVLGGVQVNTPPGYTDYFVPIGFDLYDNKGDFVEKIVL